MVVHMPCLRKWSTEQTRLVRNIVTLQGTPQVHTSKKQVSLWRVCWPSSSTLVIFSNSFQIPYQGPASWKSQHHCGLSHFAQGQLSEQKGQFQTKALHVRRPSIAVKFVAAPVKHPVRKVVTHEKTHQVHTLKHRRVAAPGSLHVKNVLTHGKIRLVHTFKLHNNSTRSEKKRFSPDPAISPTSRPGREPPSPATVDG